VGLERGPLDLVSTIEELLERKSSGPGLESREYGRRDPSRWPRGTLYPQTLALISSTSGGLSVGIVRTRTQTTEFSLVLVACDVVHIKSCQIAYAPNSQQPSTSTRTAALTTKKARNQYNLSAIVCSNQIWEHYITSLLTFLFFTAFRAVFDVLLCSVYTLHSRDMPHSKLKAENKPCLQEITFVKFPRVLMWTTTSFTKVKKKN
jgi:hypothetical protein